MSQFAPEDSQGTIDLVSNGDITFEADRDQDGAGDLVFRTGGVERARIKHDGSGTGWPNVLGGSSSVLGNTVACLGDSISANDNQTSGSLANAVIRSRSYLMWATLLSRGRMVFGGARAVGGYTTSDAITTVQADGKTLLQETVADAPAVCVVLLGTNDNGALTFAQTQANLTTIYTTLLANKIVPVCCTIPPRTGDSAASKNITSQTNVWVARYAKTHGLPFVDFFGALVDPTTGDYAANLNADTVHPNYNGARAMGQVLATALDPVLPPGRVYLSQFNADTLVSLMSGNCLFETSADGGSTATGFASMSGGPATYKTAAPDMAPNFMLGNMQDLVRQTADTTAGTSSAMTVSAGDRIYVAYTLAADVQGVDGVPTSLGSVEFRLINGDSTQELISLRGWNLDIPVGSVLAREVVVPSGLSDYTFKLTVNVSTTTNTRARVGQLTVLNLTSLGAV